MTEKVRAEFTVEGELNTERLIDSLEKSLLNGLQTLIYAVIKWAALSFHHNREIKDLKKRLEILEKKDQNTAQVGNALK